MPGLEESNARLAELRAELAAQLAARLAAVDAPLAELRELQERLKLLDATLAEQTARAARRWSALLWPLALVAAALLLAATVPVPSVPVTLTLKATAVSLDLGGDTTLGALPVTGELRVEGFSTLESADTALAQAASREQADRLAVLAAELRLRALQLPAGTRLKVQAQPKALTLDVEAPRSPVVAELELRGATQLRLGDAAPGPARDYPHGEWLRLLAGDAAHADRAAPPMALSLPLPAASSTGTAAPLRLQGLRPVRLRFSERRDGGAGAAAEASSVEGGTLSLPATGQTVALAAGDGLEIDGLTVERFTLAAGGPDASTAESGATLLLALNGSARGLKLRVGEFERSLKPSWLEYVSKHHLTQLLWGSAAVLWGALAWVRKQFAGVRP